MFISKGGKGLFQAMQYMQLFRAHTQLTTFCYRFYQLITDTIITSDILLSMRNLQVLYRTDQPKIEPY